jgi:hypothetical protein
MSLSSANSLAAATTLLASRSKVARWSSGSVDERVLRETHAERRCFSGRGCPLVGLLQSRLHAKVHPRRELALEVDNPRRRHSATVFDIARHSWSGTRSKHGTAGAPSSGLPFAEPGPNGHFSEPFEPAGKGWTFGTIRPMLGPVASPTYA